MNHDQNPAIESVAKLVAEYEVTFVDLPIPVRFRIWENTRAASQLARFYFEQSHFFHGPNQATAYVTNSNSGATCEAALERAIDTILQFYTPTIGKFPPQAAWLVRNNDY